MDSIFNDGEYINVVYDILNKNEFGKLENCRHHGLTRLDHCIRVSYYSYKVAKKLRLDYIATARAGLLHDFFTSDDMKSDKRSVSMIIHPYKALENANRLFYLSDLEKDIIINHMFPVLPHKIPKYTESWVVSFVDKIVAIYEFYCAYGKTWIYRLPNLYLILLLFK